MAKPEGYTSTTADDVFYWNGQQLYEQTDGLTIWYEPEIYDGSKLEYSASGHVWVRRKDGHTWYFGEASGFGALDLLDPALSSSTTNSGEWHLQKHIDPYGNQVLYSYTEAPIPTGLWPSAFGGSLAVARTQQTLLSTVSWAAGEAELVLSYEDRIDPYYSSISGRTVLNTQRLVSVQVGAGGAHYSRYSVDYQDNSCGTTQCAHVSLLSTLIQHSSASGSASDDIVLRTAEYSRESNSWSEYKSLPEDFWSLQLPSPIYGNGEHTSAYVGQHWTIPMAVNLDGDAFSDFVVFGFKCSRPPTTISSGPSSPWAFGMSLGPVGSCSSVTASAYQNVDVSGGRPGPFSVGQAHEPRFSSGTAVATDWTTKLDALVNTWNTADAYPLDMVDLDADGQIEFVHVVSSTGTAVVHETTYDTETGSFSTVASSLAVEDVKHGTFADVDGDGKADLVVLVNPEVPSSGSRWLKSQGGSPATFIPAIPLLLPLEGAASTIAAAGFQEALNCGYGTGGVSACDSGAQGYPANQMPAFSSSEYRTSQARMFDINGDGILDVAYSLYLSWGKEFVSTEMRSYSVEVLDCLDPATNASLDGVSPDDCDTVTETHVFSVKLYKDVPDPDSAYSRIFYGDGRGGFYDSGLSAGPPWMTYVDYSGLGDPALQLVHTFSNNAAFIDVNRSGQSELVQIQVDGSSSDGVPHTKLAAARIHHGIAQGYDLTQSGSVGTAADYARAVGPTLPISQIGSQFPLPHSTLPADWDGDGFVDFLEMTPTLKEYDALGLAFYTWDVNLHLNDRQQPEGRLKSVEGPSGGKTELEWGYSATAGHNPDLHINAEVLTKKADASGTSEYRYTRGAYNNYRFAGFGLVEVTDGTGATKEVGFSTVRHLPGYKVFEASYRLDGTLDTFRWNSHLREASREYDLEPPYFNPVQRVCSYDLDQGHDVWFGTGIVREQTISADDLVQDCYSDLSAPLPNSQIHAALGWAQAPAAGEPSAYTASVAWVEDWGTYHTLAVATLPDSHQPVLLLGEPNTGLVDTKSALLGIPDFDFTWVDYWQPAGTGSMWTNYTESVTRLQFGAFKKLAYLYQDRDTSTPDDDLVSTLAYTWDAAAWGAQLISTTTVDGAGSQLENTLRLSFAAFNLPSQVSSCGDGTGPCATTQFDYSSGGAVDGGLYGKTGPEGETQTWTRGTWCGKPDSAIDAAGRSKTYTYDAVCRLTSDESQGVERTWTHDGLGRVDWTRTEVLSGGSVTSALETEYQFFLDGSHHLYGGGWTKSTGERGEYFTDSWGRKVLEFACEDDGSGSACLPNSAMQKEWLYSPDNGRVHAETQSFEPGVPGDSFLVTSPAGDPDGTAYWYDERGRVRFVRSPSHDSTVGGIVETEYRYRPNVMYVYDALGREIRGERDTLGGEIQVDGKFRGSWELDPLGREMERTTPSGLTSVVTYDSLGRRDTEGLSTTADCMDGNTRSKTSCTRTASWDYDLSGRVTKMTRPDGVVTESEYDSAGRLVRTYHDNGSTRTLLMEQGYTNPSAFANGVLTRIYPTMGVTEEVEHDGMYRPQTVTKVSGTESYSYAPVGFEASSHTDLNGVVTGYSFDAFGRLVETCRGTCSSSGALPLETREYGSRGELLSEEDADGVLTEWFYTKTGLLETVQVSDTLTASSFTLEDRAYDDAGRAVDIFAEGVDRYVEYDAWDRPELVEYGTPGSAGFWAHEMGWTDADQLDWDAVTPVHGLGTATTTYTYDAWDQLQDLTHVDSSKESWERDVLGRVRLYEDEEQAVSESRFDSRDRISFESLAGGSAFSYTYTEGAAYAGATGLFRTDATDAVGNATTQYVDLNQREIARILPDGTSIATSWSGSQAILQEHSDPFGTLMATRAWDYDTTNGHLNWDWGWVDGALPGSSPTLGSDYYTDYTWTDAGRLSTYGGPEEDTTYTYDAGMLASETWGSGGYTHSKTFQRNTTGGSYPWVEGETWNGAGGLNRVSTFSRDSVGNILQSMVVGGSTTLYTLAQGHDGYGNPNTTERIDGTVSVEHEWDYDGRGRPSQRETTVNPGSTQLTNWEWYDNSELQAVVTPSGALLNYDRGLFGDDFLLVRAKVDGQVVGEVTARDANNRPTDIVAPGSHTTSISYDAMGRITEKMSTGAWGSSSWEGIFDGRGRLKQEIIADANTGALYLNDYDYQEPGFLVEELRGGPSGSGELLEYVLDSAGRRTETWANGVQTQSMTWNGAVLSSVDGTSISYDDWDGVTTDQHGNSYERAADGRVNYVLDSAGNTLNEFKRGPAGLVWENDEGGTAARRNTWGLGIGEYPIETVTSSSDVLTYVVADGMLLGQFDGSSIVNTLSGPSRTLLRSDNQILSLDSAFGKGAMPAGGTDDRFAYAGMETLPNTPGVQLAQQRLYDAETGRFLSPDPIGLRGGPFRSRYGLGNPTGFVDPSGYSPDIVRDPCESGVSNCGGGGGGSTSGPAPSGPPQPTSDPTSDNGSGGNPSDSSSTTPQDPTDSSTRSPVDLGDSHIGGPGGYGQKLEGELDFGSSEEQGPFSNKSWDEKKPKHESVTDEGVESVSAVGVGLEVANAVARHGVDQACPFCLALNDAVLGFDDAAEKVGPTVSKADEQLEQSAIGEEYVEVKKALPMAAVGVGGYAFFSKPRVKLPPKTKAPKPKPTPTKAPAPTKAPTSDIAKAMDEIADGSPRHNVRNPSRYANDGRDNSAILPKIKADGTPITYTEHTVNPRPPHGKLDKKRVVTGSDGSVRWTDDHYISFEIAVEGG